MSKRYRDLAAKKLAASEAASHGGRRARVRELKPAEELHHRRVDLLLSRILGGTVRPGRQSPGGNDRAVGDTSE